MDPLRTVQLHQPGPAGDDDQAPRRGRQQRQHLSGVERVVEQEQDPPLGQGGPPQGGAAGLVLRHALVRHAQRAQQRAERGGRLHGLLDRRVAAQVDEEPPVRIRLRQLVRGPHRQGGLAAAAHAVQGHDPGPLRGPLRAREQLPQLPLPTGEVGQVVRERGRGQRRRRLRRGGRRGRRGGGLLGGGQLLGVAQDRLVQPGQTRPRVHAQLLDEQGAGPAVLLQRLRGPPGAVQGEHQLAPQVLAERVLRDQGAQVADEFPGLAPVQPQLVELLGRGQPPLVQGGGRRRERRAPASRHDGAPPQGERLAQPVGRLVRQSGGDVPPGLGGQPVEAAQVELVVVHDGAVAGAVGDDQGGPLRDAAAQIGDGLADLVDGRRRRIVVPDGLDEPGDRHHPAGLQQQGDQNPFLDGPPEPYPVPVGPDLQCPENVAAHRVRRGRRHTSSPWLMSRKSPGRARHQGKITGRRR